ncbi:hypothetical protein R5W23_006005 [Gemmata sp. JC673]|uniref:Uncharacterized protein n=1 Tax=Gemmata algarum TaxID=2975278 RepID=A0ABU5EV51_9BACT|nr:hypothetical protein [Gemmata algarum]MDY3558848.1 hypothetical protein [Gemmata algarum]
MTEAEWLTGYDSGSLLRAISETDFKHIAGERKVRLFACECYRRINQHLQRSTTPVEYSAVQAAVAIAERFADNRASVSEFRRAQTEIRELSNAVEESVRVSHLEWSSRVTLIALGLAACVLRDWSAQASYDISSNAAQ